MGCLSAMKISKQKRSKLLRNKFKWLNSTLIQFNTPRKRLSPNGNIKFHKSLYWNSIENFWSKLHRAFFDETSSPSLYLCYLQNENISIFLYLVKKIRFTLLNLHKKSQTVLDKRKLVVVLLKNPRKRYF